jgi:hypothetical protein
LGYREPERNQKKWQRVIDFPLLWIDLPLSLLLPFKPVSTIYKLGQ